MTTKTHADTDAATAAGTAAGQATGATHTSDSRFSDVRNRADVNLDEAWGANIKRTYDVTQSYDTESMIRARADWEDSRDARRRQTEDLHHLKMQAFQNSVETANMIAKQAIAHRDIAIDREWNVDEVAQLVAKTPVFLDAIAAAVANTTTTKK